MVLSIIDDVETVCDGVKVPLAKATDLLNEAMATVGVTYHGLDSDKVVTFRPHSAFHGKESTVLPPPPLSTISAKPSVEELRAFISLLAAEEPKLERRAAATNGSQGSQQRFEEQRCKDVLSALRCLHIAPRGLRAGIASVHAANERAAEMVALAKSQQRKLRMHVHPDRLSTAWRGSGTPRLHRVTTEGTLSTTPMTAHFPTRAAIRRHQKAHLACARCLPCLSRPKYLPRALSRSKVCQRGPLVPLSRPYPERRMLIPMLGVSRGRAWGAARRRVCARTASIQPRCL